MTSSLTQNPRAQRRKHWSITAFLVPFVLLLYVEFWGIIPESITTPLILVSVYVTVLAWVLRKFELGPHVWLRVLWFGFALWALQSHLSSASYTKFSVVIFVLFASITAIAPVFSDWVKPAGILFIAFGSVHALSTLIFALFPALYSGVVHPLFFASNRGATGYESGLTTHYSYNATYIALSLVALACYVIYKPPARGKLFLYALLVVDGTALIFTSKRAHLILVVIAILIVFSLSGTRLKLLRSMLAIGALLILVNFAALFSPEIANSIDRLLSTTETSDLNELTTGRVSLWEAAVHGGNEQPITGQGWSTFFYSWGGGNGAYHAHNEFLTTFYSLGYPGAIVLALLVIWTLVQTMVAVKRIATNPHPDRKRAAGLAAAAAGVQIFLVLYGFTTGTLLTEVFTFGPYLLSVAMAFALGREPDASNIILHGNVAPIRAEVR